MRANPLRLLTDLISGSVKSKPNLYRFVCEKSSRVFVGFVFKTQQEYKLRHGHVPACKAFLVSHLLNAAKLIGNLSFIKYLFILYPLKNTKRGLRIKIQPHTYIARVNVDRVKV